MIRYVIKLGDGTKKYSRADLCMLDGKDNDDQQNGFGSVDDNTAMDWNNDEESCSEYSD